MEALFSLAVLAGASGGLLYSANNVHKSREQKREPSKEGFDTVEDAFPQEHGGFVESVAKAFNPLMNALDPRKVPVLPPNYSPSDVKTAQKNITSAVRAVMSKSADPSFNISMNKLNDIRVYGAAEDSKVRALAKCEAIASVNCNAFDDPIFRANCGVCHDIGKDSDNNNHIGGLLITKDAKEAAEIIARRNNDHVPTYAPSIGSCPAQKFSVSKQQCLRVQAQIDCEKKQNFDVKGCNQCTQDNRFYYIDSDIDKLGVDVWVVGSGRATFQVLGTASQPVTLNLSSTPQNIELDMVGDNVLSINVSGSKTVLPSVAGYISGKTVSGEFHVDLAQLADVDTITGRKPRINGSINVNGDSVMGMKAGTNQTTMMLQVYMPYTFLDTKEKDIKASCPGGPFIPSPSSANRLSSGPCFAKGSAPGNYSMECLQQTFIDSGCTPAGSGYPSNPTRTASLQAGGLSIGQIADKVSEMAVQAKTGNSSTGSKLSQDQQAAAASFCTGAKIANVCDIPAGTMTPACAAYLYQNNGASSSIGPTYSDGNPCSSKGTVNPVNPDGSYNAANLAKLRGGVSEVKAYYNNIQRKSTDNSLPDSERNDAIQMCYGVSLNAGGIGSSIIPVTGEAKKNATKIDNSGYIANVFDNPMGRQFSATLEPPQQNQLPSSIKLIQGMMIGTVNVEQDYTLSFDIIPKGTIGNWGSILHFTADRTDRSRMPAIWFTPGSTGLHVRTGDSTYWNWGLDSTAPLPLNQKSSFKLVCKGKSVTITVSGQTYQLTQPTYRPTGQALVYACDPWWPIANVEISNVVFLSGKGKTGQSTQCRFDAQKYSDYYGDLKNAFRDNAGSLLQHWKTFGINEGRTPCGDVNPGCRFNNKDYLDLNLDVKNANVPDPKYHYTNWGAGEGRAICP